MKNRSYQVISRLLHLIFFGFLLTLFISCILLAVNTFGSSRSGKMLANIEAVVINGSDDRSENGFNRIKAYSANSRNSYVADELNFGYESLTNKNEKELYNMIMRNAYKISDTRDELTGYFATDRFVIKDEKLSEQRIRTALNAFLSDNPEIFWLENLFGYAYDGEDTIVECYSVLAADDCTEYIQKMNTRINEILDKINYQMSDYEREKVIHDELLNHVSYQYGVTSAEQGWQYFSAYGALVDGKAVCEGYSKAMQILLTRAEIPCYTIRGEAENIGHMWNIVEIAGRWYHLDATWDDEEENINYEYFNLNTKYITKNHLINELSADYADSEENTSRYNFFIPECDTLIMNYYYAEGIRINRFDSETDEKVIAYLIEKASQKEEYIPIVFGEDLSYEEYINNLFYESPYRFYYYIDRANTSLSSENQIDRSSLKILKNEDSRTVRVRVFYN